MTCVRRQRLPNDIWAFDIVRLTCPFVHPMQVRLTVLSSRMEAVTRNILHDLQLPVPGAAHSPRFAHGQIYPEEVSDPPAPVLSPDLTLLARHLADGQCTLVPGHLVDLMAKHRQRQRTHTRTG
jgi:hypothetical protein